MNEVKALLTLMGGLMFVGLGIGVALGRNLETPYLAPALALIGVGLVTLAVVATARRSR